MNPSTVPNELQSAVAAVRRPLQRALAFSFVAALLVLAPTVYMFELYGRVVDSRNPMTLAMLTLLLLWVLGVLWFVEWARAELLREAGAAFERRLAPRVFQSVFEARLRQGAAVGVQPLQDLWRLGEFFHSALVTAMLEAPVSLVLLVVLFAISPLLGWVALAAALLQVLLAWLNERGTWPPLVAANRDAMSAAAQADGAWRNAQVVQAMGMRDALHARWHALQQRVLAQQALASDRAGLYQALGKLTQTTLGSMLLGLGAWLVLRDTLPGGPAMMIVASVLGGRVLAPLVQAVAQWRLLVQARDARARLDDLLARVPPRAPSMPLAAPKGRLQVELGSAAAPGRAAPILRGVAFALQPGELVAVIGPSASGKSTLTRLLVGLWPAQAGKVRLDGADVHAWDKDNLGPHIGYLPQTVELIEGTLAENIARFGDADPARVEAAARAVGLHEFIVAQPQGYDSPVGADGAFLSGGQRQRVGLARALYGDPALVVLDEPNSSLDEEGQAALMAALAGLKQRGAAVVVVTQLTSLLPVADRLLVLREGTQFAFGSVPEVLARLKPQAPAAAAARAAPALPAGALPAQGRA